MGLAQMLSVSQSFRVAADQPHRFRTARHGGLPRFGTPDQLNREVPMKIENSVVVEQTAGADEAAALKARGEADASGRPAQPQGLGGGMARLVSVLSAWFAFERWSLKKGARAALPVRALSKPGQQELRLENVEVCRNDLTDADWELSQPPKSGARLAFLRNLASTGSSASRRNRMPSRDASAVKT